MHEYHSQYRVVTTYYSYTSFVVFLAKHVGNHSSGTFYVAFRDPGQILIIRDCPGDSGTVGAYVTKALSTLLKDCVRFSECPLREVLLYL